MILHHTMALRVFTGDRLSRFDRIYTTAQLDDAALELSLETGFENVFPHANSSGHALTLDDLHPVTQNCLAHELAADYKVFSGFFDNPFQSGSVRVGPAQFRSAA